MPNSQRNSIEFKVWGRYAMFTDPLTKIGGEKCSYQVPTYEALKGVAKSIYWKPTFIWVIDEVRVMKRIRTQTKGTKPLNFNGVYPTLAIYTFLTGDPDVVTGEPGVEYQVRAHFEWNEHRPELANDRVEGKHFDIARRMLDRGGRQDIFLGTRDCQGYVEPCEFRSGPGHYDNGGELAFGLMFHGFDYPDETGEDKLYTRFWMPKMIDGVIRFVRPEECHVRKFVHEMKPKQFESGQSLKSVETEMAELEAQA
jgi:CRISPR-associated protein Cas5d